MLFPTTFDLRQVRTHSDLAAATSRTVPNLRLGKAHHGPQRQHQRRHSTRQPSPSSSVSSVSPIQNPRVSNIIQDTGRLASSTSSPPFQSTGPHFYASSAPSSTVCLQQQSPRTRPPVPLFSSNSTGNMNQSSSSRMTPSIPEGTFIHGLDPASSSFSSSSSLPSPSFSSASGFPLTSHDSDMSAEMFDFSADFSNTPDVSPNLSYDDYADFDPQYGSIAFESINHSASAPDVSSVQTISPQDIMVDTMSAPASTTFTNMTTPGTSYMESPLFMADSTDTSPLFAQDHLGAEADHWPSLFEDDNTHRMDDTTMSHLTGSPASNTVHVAPQMSRNSSSPGQSSSRGSHQGRHSFTSGVNPRRRDKPLPAITVADPEDVVAVKRARNTMAARKSREKRVKRTDELLARNAELEKECDYWKSIALSRGHIE